MQGEIAEASSHLYGLEMGVGARPAFIPLLRRVGDNCKR
jgi:hypothetical protein